MNNFTLLFLLVNFINLSACNEPKTTQVNAKVDTSKSPEVYEDLKEVRDTVFSMSNRDSILFRLKRKVKQNKPLIVHLFVPLCDNENQGIVPVSRALGNGKNLKTNLYWGALYGVKTFFKNKASWKLIKSELNIDSVVLERVVFNRKFSNGANVYLVADAYRGDKMLECVYDFLESLSGERKDSVALNENTLNIASKSDLLIFSGHNGLMDFDADFKYNIDSVNREAVVMACISFSYFEEYFKRTRTFPLLMSMELMAPEAYISEAIISEWAMLKSSDEIRQAAINVYSKYQKCSKKWSERTFKTGW